MHLYISKKENTLSTWVYICVFLFIYIVLMIFDEFRIINDWPLSQAMNELNGKEVSGVPIEISLAKPPSDKKKKEEMLRAREKRMMAMLQARGQWVQRVHWPTVSTNALFTAKFFRSSFFFSLRLPPQGLASGRGMRGGNSRIAPPIVGHGDYGKFWPGNDFGFRRSI